LAMHFHCRADDGVGLRISLGHSFLLHRVYGLRMDAWAFRCR
jgi:hypothetical protein